MPGWEPGFSLAQLCFYFSRRLCHCSCSEVESLKIDLKQNQEEWSLSERTVYGNIPKPSNLFIWEGGRGNRGGQRGMAHTSCFSDFPLFTVHLHCIITPVCFRKEAGGRQGALWGRWLT